MRISVAEYVDPVSGMFSAMRTAAIVVMCLVLCPWAAFGRSVSSSASERTEAAPNGLTFAGQSLYVGCGFLLAENRNTATNFTYHMKAEVAREVPNASRRVGRRGREMGARTSRAGVLGHRHKPPLILPFPPHTVGEGSQASWMFASPRLTSSDVPPTPA